MKARLVSVLASMTLATAALAVATPAQAEPVPEEQRLSVKKISIVYAEDDGYSAFYVHPKDLSGVRPADGVVVELLIWDCHGNSLSDTGTKFNPTSYHRPSWVSVDWKKRVPIQPLTYAVRYTHPGFDSYVSSPVVAHADETCPGPITPITVRKWSAKMGAETAQIGNRLAVTPTHASGATVTYAWQVGTKVVERDRFLTVEKSYRGKEVTLRVKVSKAGAKSVSRTLRFGRVCG